MRTTLALSRKLHVPTIKLRGDSINLSPRTCIFIQERSIYAVEWVPPLLMAMREGNSVTVFPVVELRGETSAIV
jgi:hypothetical protein